jgi:signal transduction histidine kinase
LYIQQETWGLVVRSTAAEIMEVTTCIVRDNTTLADVATILAHKGGEVVLVSSEAGELIGIFTETDLARAFINRTDARIPMKQIMTKQPLFVRPEDSLEACADLMSKNGFRHLPVYDGRRIFGMVEILRIQRELNERLQQSLTRLQRRDEYLSVVAHDMRSPIAVVHSCCELLRMGFENKSFETHEMRELIDRISENAEASLNLMANLLDIAQLNHGIQLEAEWVEIKPYLNSIVENQMLLAQRRNVTISLDVQPSLNANIDPNRYSEIVTNLLGNAVKVSPIGGEVKLQAMCDEREFLIVSIIDQGPGIPKDKINCIFQKHEQLESEIKKLGFGLGLSIALQFALLHNGEILVDSELGKGATFRIVTPGAKVI